MQLRTQAKLQELHTLVKVQPAAYDDNKVSESVSHNDSGMNTVSKDTKPRGDDCVESGVGCGVGHGKGSRSESADNTSKGPVGSGNSEDTKSKTQTMYSSKIHSSGHSCTDHADEERIDSDKGHVGRRRSELKGKPAKDLKAVALQCGIVGAGHGHGSGAEQDILDELLLLLIDMQQVGK
jgi:hypothetical protein